MKFRFGITFRLTLLFELFAVGIITTLSVLAYTSGRSALQTSATSGLISIATEKEAAVNAWVDSRQTELALLANSPTFMDAATVDVPGLPARPAHDRMVRDLQSWVISSTHFTSVNFIDPNSGQVLVSTDAQEEGQSMAGQPFFNLGKVGPYVQNPYKTAGESNPEMTVSTPLISNEGRLLGYLAAQLNLADLSSITNRRSGDYQTDESFLVNPSNLFVTQPRLLIDPAILQRQVHTPQVELCLAHQNGSLLGNDYRGVPVIVVFRWISARNLCLIQKMDQNEALQPVRGLVLNIIETSGLALLFSIILAFGLARTITARILALQTGVIRFGKGDLAVRLDETGSDEFATLAKNFNLMAGALSRETTELHRHLNRLYALSTDLIATADFKGRLLEINPAFEKLLGYTQAELISNPYYRFVHPADLPQVEMEFAAIGAGQTGGVADHRVVCKDGSLKWLSWNFSLDWNEQILYGVAHDLTKQKQEEAALRASEARFAAIFKNAPIAIALSRISNGELVDVNGAFINLFGYEKDQVVGRTTAELGIMPDPLVRERLLVQFKRDGFIHDLQLSTRTKAGDSIILSGNIDQVIIGEKAYILNTFDDITTEKKVRDALVESELRYRSLFENMPDGFAYCRMVSEDGLPKDFIYLQVNPAFETLTGLMDVTGKKVSEVIPGVLQANSELLSIYGRVAETGQPVNFETLIDSLRIWLNISVYSTEPGTFIALFQNITERKLADEAIRNSERLYRAIGESIDFGVWVCDPQGRNTYTSDSFLKLIGMNNEQLGADGWKTVVHPAEVESVNAAWEQALRAGDKWDCEHRVLGADGAWHPILDRGIPIRNEQGIITAWAGINLDLSPQKRIEEALRTALARFQRIIDSNVIGIVTATADGSVLEANDYYLNLIGYSRADLVAGRVRWTDITPPEYLVLDRIAIQELKVKGSSTPHEKEYFRRDGSRVWVLIADTLLPGPEEEIAAFVLDISRQKTLEASLAGERDNLTAANAALGAELTARQRAEEEISELNTDLENKVQSRTAQLASANKELEAFAYSVSHDLRAPLRGIDGWSLALLEDNAAQLDSQGRVYIDRVRAETQRMSQLIDDMLMLSRVTRAEMQTTSVDLSALALTVASRLIADRPGHAVEVVIQPGMLAQGDFALLGVVLTNLFDNAWKFTGKTAHPRVEFGQTRYDGVNPFFVRDNGVGFNMEYVQKLFGAFQRLHKLSEFPGTGIGLATVQRIINRHGGRVWAEAQENQGATFYFTLEGKP